jgi:hypothetical protein
MKSSARVAIYLLGPGPVTPTSLFSMRRRSVGRNDMRRIAVIVFVIGSVLAVRPAYADMLGTQVTGSINFGLAPTNYYDPAEGFVPAGCLNSVGGTTVTIANPDVEFCFEDSANYDSAQFTGTTITLTDIVGSGASDWTQIFTDAAFTGVAFVEIFDNFDNGGVNLAHVGNQLTFTWAGTTATNVTYSATYQLVAVPEPTSLLLLGVGGAALLARARKRPRI